MTGGSNSLLMAHKLQLTRRHAPVVDCVQSFSRITLRRVRMPRQSLEPDDPISVRRGEQVNSDSQWELTSQFVFGERGVVGTCVEVGYAFFDEISPYFAVVDFPETNVYTSYCSDTPWKSPACAMEHG